MSQSRSVLLLATVGILIAASTVLGGCTPQKSYALGFDGADDGVDCGDSETLDINDKITLEAWVRHRTGNPKLWEDMVMKGNETYGFQFYLDEGFFTFHLTSGEWRNLSSNVKPVAGVWYHIAGTYDGATQKVYVDGELENTAQWTGIIESHPNDSLMIGDKVAWDNNWLDGDIDEIRVWNIVRTESEIRENMNRRLSGRERGLVAYYRMDEGQGQTLKDSSGKRNHCRLGTDVGADGSDPKWIKTEWPYAGQITYARPHVVSAPPFRLIIPPNTLPAGAAVTMEVVSEGGAQGVRINPSPFSYGPGKAAILLYAGGDSNTGRLAWVSNEGRTYLMPTVSMPGLGLAAFISHHSTYTFVHMDPSHVNVGGADVPLWELDIEDCHSGTCDLQTFLRFVQLYFEKLWLHDHESSPRVGSTHRFCVFQPQHVSVAAGSQPNTKQVVIQPHRPQIQDSIYVPSRADFLQLMNCSDAEKELAYNSILEHEKRHVRVDQDWQRGVYGDTLVQGEVIFPDMEVGDATDEELKQAAYAAWCEAKVWEMIAPYQAPLDQGSQGSFDWSPFTCGCAVGLAGPDPNFPGIHCIDCSQKTYCPCNDPGHNKPKNYQTAADCAADCPSGMSCFAVQCTVAPNCGQ